MGKLKVIMASLAALLAPIHSMIVAAFIVTIVDLLTGIIAAKKQGIKITSAGLKQTIIKIFVYEIALIVGFVAQKYLMQDSIPVANLVATLIGCTELKSVAENLEIIAGQPFLKAFIDIISSKQNNPQ